MPASAAQIAANRRNSELSTGPRSAEGKARSRQNAVTHSLTSTLIPMVGRKNAQFVQLAAELREHYKPSGFMEEDYVEQMILARWHMLQAERLLAGYWDLLETPDLKPVKRPTERHRLRDLAAGFILDAQDKNAFTKIRRYQSDARRTHDKAQKALETLRAPKDETKPIQPVASESPESFNPADLLPTPAPRMHPESAVFGAPAHPSKHQRVEEQLERQVALCAVLGPQPE